MHRNIARNGNLGRGARVVALGLAAWLLAWPVLARTPAAGNATPTAEATAYDADGASVPLLLTGPAEPEPPIPAAPVPGSKLPPPGKAQETTRQAPVVVPEPVDPPAASNAGPAASSEDEVRPGGCPRPWAASVPPMRCGVACPPGVHCEPGWEATQPIPWQVFAHGEYIGPARLAHVPQYHLRVDDQVQFVYALTGEPSPRPYQIEVGDLLRIESVGSSKLDRQVLVQPDGAVTLTLLGQMRAAGLTLEQFRLQLEQQYTKYVKEPGISVTPIRMNTRLEELRQSVDRRYGQGGQGLQVVVTPAGTVQLPSIGSVPAQGLTLHELKQEIEARYAPRFFGLEVTPILAQRAPRYVYVLGEVRLPGRFELQGPTTVMQAIAMAGSWNVGAKLKHIVVFRRDACWNLMATQLDLHHTLFGQVPCPADEIWLRDSDVVLVPKGDLLAFDDWISLVFTRGLYGVVPFNFSFTLSKVGTL